MKKEMDEKGLWKIPEKAKWMKAKCGGWESYDSEELMEQGWWPEVETGSSNGFHPVWILVGMGGGFAACFILWMIYLAGRTIYRKCRRQQEPMFSMLPDGHVMPSDA